VEIASADAHVFENLKPALAGAGAAFTDVAKLTTYVVNSQARRSRHDPRRAWQLLPDRPALVGVSALAVEGLLIEIEAIAAVPA